MSIVLVRVDDRLLHGQIIEAWVPFCRATCVVVANDEAKRNRIQRLAIESCESTVLSVKVEGVEETVNEVISDSADRERVIVIFSTLRDLMHAYNKGFKFSILNIGNLHHNGGGRMITPSVYINKEDEEILRNLFRSGIELDMRAVPSDKPFNIKKFVVE